MPGRDQGWFQPSASPTSVPMSCELGDGAHVLRGRLHGPEALRPTLTHVTNRRGDGTAIPLSLGPPALKRIAKF
jgi:hypothetical protein